MLSPAQCEQDQRLKCPQTTQTMEQLGACVLVAEKIPSSKEPYTSSSLHPVTAKAAFEIARTCCCKTEGQQGEHCDNVSPPHADFTAEIGSVYHTFSETSDLHLPRGCTRQKYHSRRDNSAEKGFQYTSCTDGLH